MQVQDALEKNATDNLTVIVVCFSNDPPPPKTGERTFPRVLSVKGISTLSNALSDADDQNSNVQRFSGDMVISAGSSPASTSLGGS